MRIAGTILASLGVLIWSAGFVLTAQSIRKIDAPDKLQDNVILPRVVLTSIVGLLLVALGLWLLG